MADPIEVILLEQFRKNPGVARPSLPAAALSGASRVVPPVVAGMTVPSEIGPEFPILEQQQAVLGGPAPSGQEIEDLIRMMSGQSSPAPEMDVFSAIEADEFGGRTNMKPASTGKPKKTTSDVKPKSGYGDIPMKSPSMRSDKINQPKDDYGFDEVLDKIWAEEAPKLNRALEHQRLMQKMRGGRMFPVR